MLSTRSICIHGFYITYAESLSGAHAERDENHHSSGEWDLTGFLYWALGSAPRSDSPKAPLEMSYFGLASLVRREQPTSPGA